MGMYVFNALMFMTIYFWIFSNFLLAVGSISLEISEASIFFLINNTKFFGTDKILSICILHFFISILIKNNFWSQIDFGLSASVNIFSHFFIHLQTKLEEFWDVFEYWFWSWCCHNAEKKILDQISSFEFSGVMYTQY